MPDNTLDKARSKALEVSLLIAKMSKVTEMVEPFNELIEILTGHRPFDGKPFMKPPAPPTPQSVVRQVISESHDALTLLRISRDTGLTRPVIEKAIEKLLEADEIERETKKGWKRYKVKV